MYTDIEIARGEHSGAVVYTKADGRLASNILNTL